MCDHNDRLEATHIIEKECQHASRVSSTPFKEAFVANMHPLQIIIWLQVVLDGTPQPTRPVLWRSAVVVLRCTGSGALFLFPTSACFVTKGYISGGRG